MDRETINMIFATIMVVTSNILVYLAATRQDRNNKKSVIVCSSTH